MLYSVHNTRDTTFSEPIQGYRSYDWRLLPRSTIIIIKFLYDAAIY
jgi:hypothetical protein